MTPRHLVSWNVNGIRAIGRKGLLDWLGREAPDVLAMQEVRARPEQLEDALREPAGYHAYWAPAARPGYSGVALFSRAEPESVEYGLGDPRFDDEGRTLIAHYPGLSLINAYFPNGGATLARVPYKLEYCAAFLDRIEALRAAGQSIAFCGDVNTAHREIDIARPKSNVRNTGFLPEERAWMDELVGRGWVDAFRHLNPDLAGAYTWWSQHSGARERNVGWRIDYFFVSPDLVARVASAAIHADAHGSDHCPISLRISWDAEAP